MAPPSSTPRACDPRPSIRCASTCSTGCSALPPATPPVVNSHWIKSRAPSSARRSSCRPAGTRMARSRRCAGTRMALTRRAYGGIGRATCSSSSSVDAGCSRETHHRTTLRSRRRRYERQSSALMTRATCGAQSSSSTTSSATSDRETRLDRQGARSLSRICRPSSLSTTRSCRRKGTASPAGAWAALGQALAQPSRAVEVRLPGEQSVRWQPAANRCLPVLKLHPQRNHSPHGRANRASSDESANGNDLLSARHWPRPQVHEQVHGLLVLAALPRLARPSRARCCRASSRACSRTRQAHLARSESRAAPAVVQAHRDRSVRGVPGDCRLCSIAS